MFRLSYLVIIAFILHVLWEEQTLLDVSHFALYKFTTYLLTYLLIRFRRRWSCIALK